MQEQFGEKMNGFVLVKRAKAVLLKFISNCIYTVHLCVSKCIKNTVMNKYLSEKQR